MLRLITLGRLQLMRADTLCEPVHVQPKRLALLAYLALAAPDGFQRRDSLLALFWPQCDQRRARRSLRQALFHLRNTLGDGVIVSAGKEEIALAPERLWCDAVAVETALRAGRLGQALSLYQGEFLPGVFVEDCSEELEEWVQRTRERLRSRVAAGAWALAEEGLSTGASEAVLDAARRARALTPYDEEGLRRYMILRARLGDRAGALEAYAEFSRRLRREFEAEPSPESRRLYQLLKEGRQPVAAPTFATPLRRWVLARGWHPGPRFRMRRGPRTRAATLAAGLACLAALAFAGFGHAGGPVRQRPPGGVRHVALAQFTNHTRDSLLGTAVTEALRADLGQVAEVRLTGALREDAPLATLGGTEAVVTGDVVALGPGYSISARLLSARNGRVLAVLQEHAADSNYLLRAVERLSGRLRARVTESIPPVSADGMGAGPSSRLR